MKQVVQPTSGGSVRVIEVPRPIADATEVQVQTLVSVISPGTEGAVTRLARSSLLAKARARPDLVRKVIKKAQAEGIKSAAQGVRARMATDLALGYSASGIATEVGEAVSGISPGDLVATGGANKATHSEFQAVPGLLCAKVPDGVEPDEAAFATLGSIALHGLRQAEVSLGTKVVIIGLGLVGQLAYRLAEAAGCSVAGIDVTDSAVESIRKRGGVAWKQGEVDPAEVVAQWSGGRGADAVIVTAADPSSRIMALAPELCRDRATVVVVGDVGLDLDRRAFYDKELQIRFSRSYGPGRYERSYEEWGVDYPVGYVRWTEGRNLAAVLELIASGRLDVKDLVTHTFDIGSAVDAYALIESRSEPYLAIQLTYPSAAAAQAPIVLGPRQRSSNPALGLIGAGAFASSVLLPALQEAGFNRLVSIVSATGLSARRVGERVGFEKVVGDPDEVFTDPEVDAVVVATPHDSHARLTAAALRAGKHVFCEKPLALTEEELADVQAAWTESDAVLFVGFNRRWSEPVRMAVDELTPRTGPLTITYRVNSQAVPPEHWYNDRRQGGRLLGEVCHFIDTCCYLVDKRVTSVTATGGGQGELLLAEHLTVGIGFDDGSVASITYTTGGHYSTEKERIEILGGGKSITINDFRQVVIDGEVKKLAKLDKGFHGETAAFLDAVKRGNSGVTTSFLESTRATLLAAAAIGNSER